MPLERQAYVEQPFSAPYLEFDVELGHEPVIDGVEHDDRQVRRRIRGASATALRRRGRTGPRREC